MQNRNHSLVWYLFISAIVIIIIVGIFLTGRFSALPDNGSAVNTAVSRNTASIARSRSNSSSIRTDYRRLSDSTPENRVKQFSEQIEDILSQNDQLDRTRSWVEFIDGLSGDEFPDVLTAFQENGVTRERMGEYALLLNAWAKIDPLAALDYTTATTTTPFARQTILRTWAQNDQEAAIAWAKNNYKGDGANPWLVGVIRGIAGNDLERATELMNTLPYSRESRSALAAILPAVIDMEPEAARKWIDAISNERLRAGAMDRIIEKLAAVDPQGTLNWMLANPGHTTDKKMDNVFNSWMRRDEKAAIDSYQQLPHGKERSNALRGIINAMANKDPQIAAEFIDSNSDDATDHVYEQFVWSSFHKDPSFAISYIGRIQNEAKRNNMYSRTLNAWMRRDESAAFAWIESNQIPLSVIKRIEKRLQKRK